MKVVSDLNGDTGDGISCQMKLERFGSESKDDVLMYGINCTFNKNLHNYYKDYRRKVLLNLWSPCEFTVKNNSAGNGFEQVDFFNEVYCVCPFTTDWINYIQQNEKHKYIFHPFDHTYKPDTSSKDFDVCYFGGLHGDVHRECIDKIKHFNYRFLSQQRYNEVTNFNVSYKEKMDVVAKTKISVCYHLIPLNQHHIEFIKSYKDWGDNKAFSQLKDGGTYIPQLKARMHESILCKSLNLVYKDDWNVIEDFYVPYKDYIPFESNEELTDLIKKILNDWESYQDVVESAYNKCLLYGAQETYNLINRNI